MNDAPYNLTGLRRLASRLVVDALAAGDTDYLTGESCQNILLAMDLDSIDILRIADGIKNGIISTNRGDYIARYQNGRPRRYRRSNK